MPEVSFYGDLFYALSLDPSYLGPYNDFLALFPFLFPFPASNLILEHL